MNANDFSHLDFKDFESLALDLIEIDRGTRIERFKEGKDDGIDGRYLTGEKVYIIQCKHYVKSGINKLIKKLENEELAKIQKHKPYAYLIATSVDLSPANKEKIQKIFGDYIKSPMDIYGQGDLRSILEKNPHIQENYPELWSRNVQIIQNAQNQPIIQKGLELLEQIQRVESTLIKTQYFYNGIEFLQKNKIIVITGEPGIGKTTLAHQLILHFTQHGYEPVHITKSIEDAEKVYSENKKQVFFFDDFLGSNYLSFIEDRLDSQIVAFSQRIHCDTNKLLILTSRTNILNRGSLASDQLRYSNLNSRRYILKISNILPIEKARILHSLLKHNGLDNSFFTEICKDKRYRTIIFHKNFNPRLISFISDHQKVERNVIRVDNYWDWIQKMLDNPHEIWRNTFEVQSDKYIQILVFLVVLNRNSIMEKHLKNAYHTFLRSENHGSMLDNNIAVDGKIEETVYYFLNRNLETSTNEVYYTLFNPSIADFILKNHMRYAFYFAPCLASLQSFDAISYFMDSHKNKLIETTLTIEVIKSLYNNFEPNIFYDADYAVAICFFAHELDLEDMTKTKFILQSIFDRKKPIIKSLKYFVRLVGLYHSADFIFKDYSFFDKLVEHAKSDFCTITLLDLLVDIFGIFELSSIKIKLKDLVMEYLSSEIYDEMYSLTYSSFQIGFDYDGEPYFYNEYEISNKLDDFFDSIIQKLPHKMMDLVSFEEAVIGFDIEDYKEHILSNISDGDWDDEGCYPSEKENWDDIDSLFQNQ